MTHNTDHDESYSQRVQEGACGPTSEDMTPGQRQRLAPLDENGRPYDTAPPQTRKGFAWDTSDLGGLDRVRADLAHENLAVYPGKRPEDCTKDELEDPGTIRLANGNLLPPQYMREGQDLVFQFQVAPESLERLKDHLPRPLVSITATKLPATAEQALGMEDSAPLYSSLGEPLEDSALPNLDVFVVFAKLDPGISFLFYVDSERQAETVVHALNMGMAHLEMASVYGWARVTNLADLMVEGL